MYYISQIASLLIVYDREFVVERGRDNKSNRLVDLKAQNSSVDYVVIIFVLMFTDEMLFSRVFLERLN